VGPLSGEQEWIDLEHEVDLLSTTMNTQFLKAPVDKEQIFLLWGTKALDTSDTSIWNSTYYGEPIWDEEFNLNSTTSQEHLKAVCSELKQLDVMASNDTATCWIDVFESYAQQ